MDELKGLPSEELIQKKIKWEKEHACERFEKQYFAMVEKLKKGETFSHIRYGDGECNCCLTTLRQSSAVNYDGDYYGAPTLNKEMVKALTSPILSDDFIYGMADHCGTWTAEMKENGIWSDKIKFWNAEVFIWATVFGQIDILFNMLKKVNSVLVSPPYLTKTNIKFNTHIETPTQNTWSGRGHDLVEELYQKAIKMPEKSVFLFCTGMSTIPIIYYLHNKLKGRHFLIDIGSVIDPYVDEGRYRSWMELIPPKRKKQWIKQ